MRLSEKAYHLIKEKIITLELPPLSVIDQQALMEELELGRTPIREALHRLAAEGLVNIVPRRGMFVANISITDLQKIFEVRILLEGLCARLAAQRITEDQIAQVEAILQDLERVPNEDVKILMAIDEHFHHLLYQAAHNEFLAEILDRLYAPSLRLWYLVLDRLGDVREAIEQHQGIAEAVKAGDGTRAEALIQKHITQFQQGIKAVL
ncbi:MAG: GntR family transcriptional regulator [Anaerolineales bacterium]|nr:GntR family transcriptional regulator [Anaerolineales bacterium]